MTEKISLNLTLEELEIIDKYIELNDDTRQLFDKIREAYPKSPEEKAYKRWWGDYPPTEPSKIGFEDNMWSAFQKGYQAAKEDLKVGEEPKPESLENILWEWWEDAFTTNSNLDMEATLAILADKVYSWHEKLR
jgi:hypothetical protein